MLVGVAKIYIAIMEKNDDDEKWIPSHIKINSEFSLGGLIIDQRENDGHQ